MGGVGGDFFNEVPPAVLAEVKEKLNDLVVINGLLEAIALGGETGVVFHLNGYEQSLRFGPFFVRHTYVVMNFEINYANFGHGWKGFRTPGWGFKVQAFVIAAG